MGEESGPSYSTKTTQVLYERVQLQTLTLLRTGRIQKGGKWVT